MCIRIRILDCLHTELWICAYGRFLLV
uniref:Uncharacterized protein n=1 Tax=Rhizophora mucronata TaxID=61149 RepID=A0A2P2LBF2_RHIMU